MSRIAADFLYEILNRKSVVDYSTMYLDETL